MVVSVQEIGQRAKTAATDVAGLTITTRNDLLRQMSQALLDNQSAIMAANKEDIAAYANTLSQPMIKRLTLDQSTIKAIATSLLAVVALPDPLAGDRKSVV